MSAAARLGQRFTYVEEKAEMPEPLLGYTSCLDSE